MKTLEGIRRFEQSVFPGRRAEFEALAEGQQPELMLITCADSRIDPALLTQAAPGDVFVIRNAGNFVPPHGEGAGEAATLEFGIEALGIQHVAVCGHARCGAMAAALDPASAEGLPAVSAWLRHAEGAVDREVEIGADADRLTRAAAANVLTQIDHLRTHPSVAAAEARGALTIHAWLYDFVAGALWVGDPATGCFERLEETAGRAA